MTAFNSNRTLPSGHPKRNVHWLENILEPNRRRWKDPRLDSSHWDCVGTYYHICLNAGMYTIVLVSNKYLSGYFLFLDNSNQKKLYYVIQPQTVIQLIQDSSPTTNQLKYLFATLRVMIEQTWYPDELYTANISKLSDLCYLTGQENRLNKNCHCIALSNTFFKKL
jgi:hypothetical protein